MAKVLIAGCGAIGSELAKVLSAQGHEVTGLKRNPRTSASSRINYVAADISSSADLAALDNDFTQVFFIVSPDGRTEQSYRAVYETGLNNLLAKFPQAHWLMVSSTSVYGQSQGEWVDEDSVAEPDTVTSRIIRQAEQSLLESNPENIVVRFSGIYGPDREYLLTAAMQTPAVQQHPSYFTNRIHQLDCVGVLSFILEKRLMGNSLARYYLASDDDPAPIWEVMTWLADRLNCKLPTVKTVGIDVGMNKRCRNARLKGLGYQFKYPSYKDGYLQLINARMEGVNNSV